MRRAHLCPALCREPVRYCGVGQYALQLHPVAGVQPLRQLGVEIERVLQQVVIVIPDHGSSGCLRAVIHVQEVISVGEHFDRVFVPAHFAVDQGITVAVDAQPSRQDVRFCQQTLERPQQQGGLQLQAGFECFCRLVTLLVERRTTDLLPRVLDIKLVRLGFQLTDCREVRHDETCRWPRVDILAYEPVDQPVVKLQVGRQVLAAHTGAAYHLGHALVGFQTRITHGQQQGNVGVVSTRKGILHEDISIGVVQADTLIVANFTVECIAPAFDNPASGRLQRLVGRIQPRFHRVVVTQQALRARQGGTMSCQQHHGFHQ